MTEGGNMEKDMDMDKFYKLITNDEELADIPITYIFKVAIEVFKIISSGECNYKLEDIAS